VYYFGEVLVFVVKYASSVLEIEKKHFSSWKIWFREWKL